TSGAPLPSRKRRVAIEEVGIITSSSLMEEVAAKRSELVGMTGARALALPRRSHPGLSTPTGAQVYWRDFAL
ncbi:hypothetical protein, partial [Maricaulis sp.]|uniref:hypothetical protein n=1 Tax=Maricaulis sp. TaxID=1486257 RepID=UPI003A954B1F